MLQGAYHAHLLAVAQRQIVYLPLHVQPQAVGQTRRLGRAVAVAQTRRELHQLAYAHAVVELDFGRQVAHAGQQGLRRRLAGHAKNPRLAVRGAYQPQQHTHEVALACAVGPYEAEDLAAAHDEVHVLDAARTAVPFREARRLDDLFLVVHRYSFR